MTTTRSELPDKLFFKIGEVTGMVGVKPHVLRYWETEFPRHIRPQKSRTNQRLYRRKDVENILAIQHLLYDLKYTIEGARRYLNEQGAESAMPPEPPEAIIDAAVRDARAAVLKEQSQNRASTRSLYEKKLLELKSDLKAHILALEKELR